MQKIKPNDPKSQSANIVDQNIEQLKQLFPEVFKEGKIDWEELQATLGEHIDTENERFNFTWNGKSQARREAQKPSTGTLRPCPEESVDWENTQNLYIEGDNLEVLKLLQKSYHQKVKMIYIDPPYNTGNDFVYKDNYKDNLNNYLELTGQTDDEGKKLSTNSDASGRYHSNWLNMMYPRLKLARNLLKEDGIIFISIDDNEGDNLRKVCNEIFGEENYLSSIVWEKRFTRSNNAKTFASLTETLLCYRKSNSLEYVREPRNEKADSTYTNPDNDPRGVWTSVSYVNPATKSQRPNLVYTITNPTNGKEITHPTNAWKYEEKAHKKHVEENRLYWGKEGENTYPRLKRFLSEMDNGMVPVNFWKRKDTGTTDEGSKELEKLMEGKYFDFPKPHSLIKRAISHSNSNDDIILDFFSGSATTAHAVMQLNAEDGGYRKHIQVQLPEPTEEKSEAFKVGYKTIAEIGKERIRRAAKKIAEENPEKAKDLDLGFKVFKLDSSNIHSWDPETNDLESYLNGMINNLKDDRNEQDILFEILLKYGLDLTVPITEHQVAGVTVYNVGMGALLICLADGITVSVAEGIAQIKEEQNPEFCRVVFKDTGFANSVIKTNVLQKLKQHSIEEVRSI